MATSIDALDLPMQFFAVGTAMGMFTALLQHLQTGSVDHWPVHVAICALSWFAVGLLFSVATMLG